LRYYLGVKLNLVYDRLSEIFYLWLSVLFRRDIERNLIKIWLFYYPRIKPNSLIFLKFDKFKMIASFDFAILLASLHDINLIAQICFFATFLVSYKV